MRKKRWGLALLAGLLLIAGFPACDKDEEPMPPDEMTIPSSGAQKIPFQIDRLTFDEWVVLNLETAEVVEIFKDSPTTPLKDFKMSGKPWHLAFNRFNVQTHNGEALLLDVRRLEDIKSLPAIGWTRDQPQTLMMAMGSGYAERMVNPVLGQLDVPGADPMNGIPHQPTKNVFGVRAEGHAYGIVVYFAAAEKYEFTVMVRKLD